MVSVENICEALARLTDCAHSGELSGKQLDKIHELHNELSKLKQELNGQKLASGAVVAL